MGHALPTSDLFHRTLMQALGKTIPHATQEEWAEKWDSAREEFDSLAPRTPAEARLAAFAVAAMAGAMDNFDRAAKPGLSDEKAGRLRGSALAVGRFYKSVMATLRKPLEAPAKSAPPEPEPQQEEPTPRRRFQDTAPAQPRASDRHPRDPECEEEAALAGPAIISTA